MTILADRVRRRARRIGEPAAMLAQLAKHDEQLAIANAGGGPRYVERTASAASCSPASGSRRCSTRTRPFLELSPLAAWGTEFPSAAAWSPGSASSRASSACSSPTTRPCAAGDEPDHVRKNAAGDADRRRTGCR
jgi:hypothetical protein